jgi:hypothetical protein
MPTGLRHIAGGLCRPLQHLESPHPLPRPQGLGTHKAVSTSPTALILCSKDPNQTEESLTVNPVLGFHMLIRRSSNC